MDKLLGCLGGRGSARGGDGNVLRGPAMARGAAHMGVGHMEVGRGDI